jgi:hypothetical protein
MRTSDLQADGLVGDALIMANSALCLIQDLLADALKVIKPFSCTEHT